MLSDVITFQMKEFGLKLSLKSFYKTVRNGDYSARSFEPNNFLHTHKQNSAFSAISLQEIDN